jgi:hypothetical protein
MPREWMEGGNQDHAGLHARNLAMLGLGTSLAYYHGMWRQQGGGQFVLGTFDGKTGRPLSRAELARKRGVTFKSFTSQSDMVPPTPAKTPRKRKNSATASSSKTGKKARKTKKTAMKGKGRQKVKSQNNVRKGKKTLSATAKKFAKDGFVAMSENNGIQSTDHCMYIGHGTDSNSMYNAIWYAAYKSLINKAGFQIRTWEDLLPLGSGGKIHAYYRADDGNSPISGPLTVLTSFKTHSEIVNELLSTIRSTFPAAVAYPNWNRLELLNGYSTGEPLVLDGFTQAVLDLVQYKITIDYKSTLKLQNRSLAPNNTGTGEDLADEDGTNVANQPLVGKLYRQQEWLNGFLPSRKELFGGAGVPNEYVPLNTKTTGLIYSVSDSSAGGLGPVAATNPFRKPPPAYVMGNKVKSGQVTFGPGEIRLHKFVWDVTMSFNTFTRKLCMSQDYVNENIVPVGHASVYAFEKMLSMGASDRKIVLAWQIDQLVRAYGRSSKPKTLPLTFATY